MSENDNIQTQLHTVQPPSREMKGKELQVRKHKVIG